MKSAIAKMMAGFGETVRKTPFCSRHSMPMVIHDDPIAGGRLACPACEAEENAEKTRSDRIRLNRKCRIEPMFYRAAIETYRVRADWQRKAVDAVRGLIETRSGKLVMAGANGTGKTHLAVAAVRELRGQIWSMYEISARIRATYTAGASEDELRIVKELASLPMLAIDEIGRTKGSDAETNWLSHIIDKRHVRRLPLILITNKHVRRNCPKGGCKDCLENYIANNIASRLKEDGLILRFTGDDYRENKRREANKIGLRKASELQEKQQ